MDLMDWILCFGVAGMFGLSFGILIPPYGWIAGIVVAVLMLFRAKKKRDSIKNSHKD